MRSDSETVRTIGRWGLGAFLMVAGTGHLTVQRVRSSRPRCPRGSPWPTTPS